MKRALGFLCLLCMPMAVLAQTPAPAPPQMFIIHEEVARPSMIGQYESSTRDLLAALSEKKADPAVFRWTAFSTPDFHYLYVAPIANFAGVDTMTQGWMNMGQTLGKERWADLNRRNGAAMSSFNEFEVVRRQDLSYVPAAPRLKASEVAYVHWSFYYLDTARSEDEIDQVAKDYASLFRSKNITDPFTVYQALNGTDLPFLVVSTPARSAADYYSEEEHNAAILGADERPLAARALSMTRRFEVRDGMVRSDLSAPQPAPAK